MGPIVNIFFSLLYFINWFFLYCISFSPKRPWKNLVLIFLLLIPIGNLGIFFEYIKKFLIFALSNIFGKVSISVCKAISLSFVKFSNSWGIFFKRGRNNTISFNFFSSPISFGILIALVDTSRNTSRFLSLNISFGIFLKASDLRSNTLRLLSLPISFGIFSTFLHFSVNSSRFLSLPISFGIFSTYLK